MKKINRVTALVLSFIAILSLAPAPQSFAAGNRIGFYLTPAAQTVTNGDSFSVKFMLDISNRFPGVIGINGKLTFPNKILNVSSVDTSTSNYMHFASTTFDNNVGTITFNRANYFPTDQSTYVFTINFKAVGVGTASVAFDSTTSGQNYPPTYANGGTYVSRAPTCPAGQIGTPPNCSTPAPTPTPKPSPSPAPTPVTAPTPVVDVPTPDTSAVVPVQTDAGDLSIRNVTEKATWKNNTVTWSTTLTDAASAFSIGTTKDKLSNVTDIIKQPDGTSEVNLKDLTPGTRYYYAISATAANDTTKKATYSGAFTTRGYPVTLTFTRDTQPLPGAKIALSGGSYTTDKDGVVQLELADKKYDAAVTTSDEYKTNISFAVAKKTIPTDGSDPDAQTFSFVIAPSINNSPASSLPIGLIIASVAGGIALIGGLFGFLLYRRKRAEQMAIPVAINEDYSWTSPVTQTDYQPVDQTPQDYTTSPNEQPQSVDESGIVSGEQYMSSPESASATYDVEQRSSIDQEYSDEQLPDNYEQPASSDQITPDNITSDLSVPQIDKPLVDERQADELSLIEQEQPLSPDDSSESNIEQPIAIEAAEVPLNPPSTSGVSANTGAVYDPATGELDIIHRRTPVVRFTRGTS